MSNVPSPAGYKDFLKTLTEQIRQAQIRAALSLNREVVLLYWQIGRSILHQQQHLGWGAKVIDRLARDLHAAFPEMKGFSARNLKYMRAFADAYPDELFIEQTAGKLPWFHLCTVLDKVKQPSERKWYIEDTIQHGWSRNVLVHQIESGLFHRQGQAVTNFNRTLPAPQFDLARQVLKDPYTFDFLTQGDATHERDLERALLAAIL